MILDLRTVLVF